MLIVVGEFGVAVAAVTKVNTRLLPTLVSATGGVRGSGRVARGEIGGEDAGDFDFTARRSFHGAAEAQEEEEGENEGRVNEEEFGN